MTISKRPDGVYRVTGWDLTLEPVGRWLFAEQKAPEIEAYWRQRSAANPALFNGRVMMCSGWSIVDGVFHAKLVETDFANFLFWRDHHFPDRAIWDAFGSAAVWTSDRRLLLGEAGGHTINAGRAYLPGGFIDPRDAMDGGRIDLVGSVERELVEETGFALADLRRRPGGLVVKSQPLLSLVVEFESPLVSEVLAARVADFIAREAEPEIARAFLIDPVRERLAQPTAPYMSTLLDHLRRDAALNSI